MNITLMVISIYIRMKLIVALYRGVQFFSHVRMDPTLPGFNQYCRELLMCLAQGHNKVTHVGIETRTSLFGVPHSTTTPAIVMIVLPIKFFPTSVFGVGIFF